MPPVDVCPRCGSDVLHRARRMGLLEVVLSRIYVYPFRCGRCFSRFRLMQWGQRYIRRTSN